MKSTKVKQGITGVLLTFLTALVFSQIALSDNQVKQKKTRPTASMDDVLRECKKHHAETIELIDLMTDTLNKAQKSGDPEIMRTTLTQIQKTLVDMKEHLNVCLTLMSQHRDADRQKP